MVKKRVDCFEGQRRYSRLCGHAKILADKVLSQDDRGFPILDVASLAELEGLDERFIDYKSQGVKKAVSAGFLSPNREGNFSLESELCPGFSLDPRDEQTILYFTSNYHCTKFGENLYSQKTRYKVIAFGDYPIAPPIGIRQWKEIFAKLLADEGQEQQIINQLYQQRVIIKREQENSGFSAKFIDPKTDFVKDITPKIGILRAIDIHHNLENEPVLIFNLFASEEDAMMYIRALPDRLRNNTIIAKHPQ